MLHATETDDTPNDCVGNHRSEFHVDCRAFDFFDYVTHTRYISSRHAELTHTHIKRIQMISEVNCMKVIQ